MCIMTIKDILFCSINATQHCVTICLWLLLGREKRGSYSVYWHTDMDEMGTRHMPLMYFYNVVRNHESLHATLNVTLGLRTDSELNTKGFERLFSNPTPFNHHAHFKVDRDKMILHLTLVISCLTALVAFLT